MLNKLLVILFGLMLNTNNQYSVLGKVYDINTKEELVGVEIISDCDTVYTDINGCFKIKCNSDTTNLIIKYCSYEIDTENVTKICEKFLEKK
jgi:hypothetical protein